VLIDMSPEQTEANEKNLATGCYRALVCPVFPRCSLITDWWDTKGELR